MTQKHIFLLGLLIIVVSLSLIPYKKEKFEMDIDLDKMSCLNFLKNSPTLQTVYNGVQGNTNRSEVVKDMERAVIPAYTPDGVVYNDSEYCVIRQDKLSSYNMNNSCRLGDYQLIHGDNKNYGPEGCVVNPRDSWFLNFLDEGYNVKNRDDINRINNLNNALSDSDNRIRNVNNTLQAVSGQLNDSLAEAAGLRGTNSILQSQVDSANMRYNDLYTKLQLSIGRTIDFPAPSALQIRQTSGTTQDGIYYINCGGVAKPVYCIMDPSYDGGGWMMIMKMAPSSTFHYSSSYWTSANVLNEGSLDMSSADAKFQVFNTNGIKDVMAIFPSGDTGGLVGGSITGQNRGWTWLVNNWWSGGAYITALSGFQQARDANPSDPYRFSGWTSRIWSSQEPSRRFVFGGHGHLGAGWSGHANDWGTVRWGFVFNENGANDFRSNDAWGGIGGGNRYNGNVHGWGGNQYFSAGDYFGCCGRAGINRRISALMFGR